MSMEHDPASRDPWPAAPSAKPLEWEPAGADDYSDKRHGFYIAHQPDDEPAYRWQAAWGEGDSFNFATLAEAKAWCQEQLDAWVREFVVAPGPDPLTEVITWVPVEQAERPTSDETVAVRMSDGDWMRGYCDET